MQYTIRNIPEEVDRAARLEAERSGLSLNEALIRALRFGLGVGPTPDVTRRELPQSFDGTPLEWMVPDAAWKVVPSPVRSLSVRLAHVWHEGGVALKYDAIMTNSNSFSRTVFELVDELAASFESATTGLLSWRDAKQAIIGDSMFVFARGHPFVLACMENFKTAYAAHFHAYGCFVSGTESKRN